MTSQPSASASSRPVSTGSPVEEDILSVGSEDTSGAHPKFGALVLSCIGVVYGDIGTSPLYAFKSTMAIANRSEAVSMPLVFGALSLIVWALAVVVTLKYVVILLQADNHGEGGTLTLEALAQQAMGGKSRIVLVLGVLGASFYYGDAVVTPAMSVLSAMEGVDLIAPELDRYIVPVTLVILIGLFSVQRFGTGRVSALFAPVMVIWFLTLGGLGLYNILSFPSVLNAVHPRFALNFLVNHAGIALAILGVACLAVSGAEGLYADLGHFGPKPIRFAWFGLVFPCLLLNYFGQGALVLHDPTALRATFFRLVPEWGLVPLILLATMATIIASQAVITGAFSMTQQAMQLGLLPRMKVLFTSATHQGQIYIPRVNYLLLACVCVLVLYFRTSTALSSAYGISVFSTMTVTSVLGAIVIWKVWRWHPVFAFGMMLPFFLVDFSFVIANMTKFFHGGYAPVIVAAVVSVIMWTWIRGRMLLFDRTRNNYVPLADLLPMLKARPPDIVEGTAVFLTTDPETTPAALLHNLKHNRVLHQRNIILTVTTLRLPHLKNTDRVRVEEYAEGFLRVRMAFGYMESPNIPLGFQILRKKGIKNELMKTSFFLSRRVLKASSKTGMPLWQDHLFISLSNAAGNATDFFRLPTDRVVEIGTQVLI
ncbi:MAG: potassium transporter Kup [Methylobacteriaceae bacterium]|jgi:KUP system potassium uptake protein|nr:potassium transporter Kup [Methylobacteriaceae bacterium]